MARLHAAGIAVTAGLALAIAGTPAMAAPTAANTSRGASRSRIPPTGSPASARSTSPST